VRLSWEKGFRHSDKIEFTILDPARDMVGGSQGEKCGYKYVIYTFTKPVQTLDINEIYHFVENASPLMSLDRNSIFENRTPNFPQK